MTTKKLTKLLALYLPYILLGLVATNFGEAWRLAEGKELGDKIMAMMGTIPLAFANPLPSLHPLDLLIGFSCGAGLRLAVYLRSKNAKKYRHGMEYGSARWGTAKDIEPFQAPKFADNIILTKTERLMMSNRPPDPKNARNKNVLVVGGSGSGKTRFWLKPNLLQCHSSYVVTDPKGTIVLESLIHRTAIILSRTSLSARPSPSDTTADFARRIWKCTVRYCSMSWCYPTSSLSIAPRLTKRHETAWS